MSRMRVAVLTGLTGLVVAAPAAQAHVTLNPRSVTANSFGRLDVRVPNERDEAEHQDRRPVLPARLLLRLDQARLGLDGEGLDAQARHAGPERRRRHHRRGRRRSRSARTRRSDWILPGQFEEFGSRCGCRPPPERTLYFPARQTYSNGEVVNWNGGAGSAARAAVRSPSEAARLPRPRVLLVRPRRTRTRRSRASRRSGTRRAESVSERARDVQGEDADRRHRRSPSGGATVALKSSGLLSSNKAVIRAGAEVQADAGQLQGQLARPRR